MAKASDRDTDEDSGMGVRFWLMLAGIAVVCAIGAGVIFLIIGAAWYAWGFFGTLLVIGVVALLYGLWYDRRHPSARGRYGA
jgi:uncharacterized membrane protein